MHLTVGYLATPTGDDGVALAGALAATFDATADIVLVVHHELPDGHPGRAQYQETLVKRGEEWVSMAAETLAANGKTVGGHVIGSVAGALLHCSPTPVALAPRGYAEDPPPTITAVTAAVPTRPGDDNPLPFAITLASAAELPIRMLSLVSAENLAEAGSVQEVRQLQVVGAEENLAVAARALPDAPEIASLVADGTTLESALKKLKEVGIVGPAGGRLEPIRRTAPGVPRFDGGAHPGRHRRAGRGHPPWRGLAFDHPPRRTCGHCEFRGRFAQWAHVRRTSAC